MAAVNALDLPSSSSFRDPGQVPLPEDPVEAPVEETRMMEEDSSTMWELVEQIEAHTELIDLDNLASPNTFEVPEVVGPQPNPVPPAVEKF